MAVRSYLKSGRISTVDQVWLRMVNHNLWNILVLVRPPAPLVLVLPLVLLLLLILLLRLSAAWETSKRRSDMTLHVSDMTLHVSDMTLHVRDMTLHVRDMTLHVRAGLEESLLVVLSLRLDNIVLLYYMAGLDCT